MSRAIRSNTLTPPNNFSYELSSEASQEIQMFINKYTTINQQSLYSQNTSYQELAPNTDIEMSVNDVFDLSRTLEGQESGENWMSSNSLINSMKELDMLSNELTLYNFIQPHSNPFFELNEYTKKLFENANTGNRLDQEQLQIENKYSDMIDHREKQWEQNIQ